MNKLNYNNSSASNFVNEKEFLFRSADMLNRSIELVEFLIKNFNVSNANSKTSLVDDEKVEEKHEHVPCGKTLFKLLM